MAAARTEGIAEEATAPVPTITADVAVIAMTPIHTVTVRVDTGSPS
jgi:hypothetical protein